ncbi:MAG: relaxase domain-containing protein [Gammaproteobacteria bacterium]|nr:relaxase domain-containing protein [Gammaproteobacteria bacterium]
MPDRKALSTLRCRSIRNLKNPSPGSWRWTLSRKGVSPWKSWWAMRRKKTPCPMDWRTMVKLKTLQPGGGCPIQKSRELLFEMVASIGALASSSQGVSYYERDGYYARDDPEHKAASAWTGKGAADLGLQGPVDPEVFQSVLEGTVPDGSGQRLGRRERDGSISHRPGRDLTFSAPKSVSLASLVGGDERVTGAHDQAVRKALDWFERNAAETRMKDPATGDIVRRGNQKTVIATFRHDTSRNLDPALHTHSVIANMVKGPDDRWRSLSNEKLYASKMLLGALYRSELARGLMKLGYGIEKTHADGRFEIAGVSRRVIEAFSTRRAEIEAAVAERSPDGAGSTEGTAGQRLAERAALMTRAAKRDMDREGLRNAWQRQAADLGFDAGALVAKAMAKAVAHDRKTPEMVSIGSVETGELTHPAAREVEKAVDFAVAHLSEREAVFGRAGLAAAALAWNPGMASIDAIEREVESRLKAGTLHAARLPGLEDCLTTDKALADERETTLLMKTGQGRGTVAMHGRAVDKALRNGPLTNGQKEAVRLILSAEDRTVGVQGYAGSGKTTMLNRARALLEKKGYEVRGLAPSASAARTLEGEAGIPSETLQRFLMRHNGVAEGRMTKKGERALRMMHKKTVLVVDEGSLASTVQARDLLRIADALRIPRLVLVGDRKQLDAVDAGKPFFQLQEGGMRTAVMGEILRQRDPDLKAAVEASLSGDIRKAFEKLGNNIAEVNPDNLAGAAAARWLALSPENRENAGLMAPSHELRKDINGIVRERLVRDGVVHGPSLPGEVLVSRGYTNAEKSLVANYSPGDVVAFYRPYKRLGVEKGDELRVKGVDGMNRTVLLEGKDGNSVPWKPGQVGARNGGVEVYRTEEMELRAGDRIRWTRNDAGLGLVNSQTAEVVSIRNGRVCFRLEDSRMLELEKTDEQLRHIDRAWASTVHTFQGRTVDTVIAAMEANHPNLTTQKTLYVEISRARHRAELVTDDREALREKLEMVTGERIAALESIQPKKPGREMAREKSLDTGKDEGNSVGIDSGGAPLKDRDLVREPKGLDRGMEL